MFFQKRYFLFFALLLITEVLIAVYVDDNIVRPYVGDFLVVILLYCGVKSFVKDRVLLVALSVLLFSFLIEFLQYLNFVRLLGLQHSRLANTLIGNYFTWADIVAYSLGIVTVLVLEKNFGRKEAAVRSV